MSDLRGSKFLTLLDKMRTDHAVNCLLSPKDPTAFEYGRVSGFLQGLQVAHDTYLSIVKEEEKRRNERSDQV